VGRLPNRMGDVGSNFEFILFLRFNNSFVLGSDHFGQSADIVQDER